MISIVIPFKNSRAYISDTIKSVLAQTYQSWNCIMVDDQSTDGGLEEVLQVTQKDSRFSVLQGNGGANACRNIGVVNATNEYLIFLDADDQLKPDCLQDRIDFFRRNPDCDFIVSQTSVYKEDASRSTGVFKPDTTEVDDLLLAFVGHRIQWNTTAPTWKKSFLEKVGGWKENYPRLQDVELNIRALLHNPKVGFLHRKDSYFFCPLLLRPSNIMHSLVFCI